MRGRGRRLRLGLLLTAALLALPAGVGRAAVYPTAGGALAGTAGSTHAGGSAG